MIKMSLTVNAARVVKNLRDIQTKDLPAAKASAFVRAGAKVNTEVSTYLANTLGVPKWMVAGVSVPGLNGKKKSKGSRIGRTKYIKKVDGIFVIFRHRNLNPGGNSVKQVRLSATKRGVRKHGRFYPGAIVKDFGYFDSIYKREGRRLKLQSIKITRAHVSNVRRITKTVGPRIFKDRFEHEFSRRAGRRGSR